MPDRPLPLGQQEQQLHKIREALLRPMAERFGYPLSGGSDPTELPTVLCLGNHSSGKSTFINHLAGEAIQDTGVAPTDDGFTIILYGESATNQDGHFTVVDPALPFSDLQQYGKAFLDHLRVKRRPLSTLKNVCLIDSPGLIDNPSEHGDSNRGYDFRAVVRAFAQSADLIVFFFDPDKPGTTGESLRVFTDSLSEVMYKLLIVFHKVDRFDDVRDFARTYGALCWNLSRVVRTKDIPPIYCTYAPEQATTQASRIDLADFEKSTNELKEEIRQVDERRRTNVVSALLNSARQLRFQAVVVHRIGTQLLWLRLGLWAVAAVLLGGGAWLLWAHHQNSYAFWFGIFFLVGGLGLGLASNWILRRRLRYLAKRSDKIFREVFREELLRSQHSRFLEEVWESVEPRTQHFLLSVSPWRVPCSPAWKSRLRKLQQAIDSDIPDMLRRRE